MAECQQLLWTPSEQNLVLSDFPQSPVPPELVGNLAYRLPGVPNAQYPVGSGPRTGASVSTKSPCTPSRVLALPSRSISANVETLGEVGSKSGYSTHRLGRCPTIPAMVDVQ